MKEVATQIKEGIKIIKEHKKALWISFAIFAVIYILFARFAAERFEANITARDEGMQNVWSIASKKIKMAGFTENAFSKTYLEGIKANAQRYANDKENMMKWVQESANQLTPDVHKKVLDIFEKAYAEQERAQSNKISEVQEYRIFLNSTIQGTVARVMSYPKLETEVIMNRIITTKKTKVIWDEGIEREPENPFEN